MHAEDSALHRFTAQDEAHAKTLNGQESAPDCLIAPDNVCAKTVDKNESDANAESEQGNHLYENKANLLEKRPLTPVYRNDSKRQRSLTARTLRTFRTGIFK